MPASTIHTELSTAVQHPAPLGVVPKELVHRDNAAEVLLTGWQRQDADRFTVTALWPRGHSFFTSVDNGSYDPLLIAETMRQLCILLPHTEFGVPLGHHFLLQGLRVTVQPQCLRIDETPAQLDIEVTGSGIEQRRGVLTEGRFQAVFRRAGEVVATAAIDLSILSPGVYQRVRGGRNQQISAASRSLLAPGYQPQTVGRVADMDVVLAPDREQDKWQVRADARHPIFFDHPLDHVPGMLLLEAARQAAARLMGRSSLQLFGIGGEFHRYVELDAPCVVEARHFPQQRPGDKQIVIVTGHQHGELCFNVTVSAAQGAR
ncbi:ScbA/BarX family gamma-butyrolactone biosynthesis protein [Kitasatospora sp. LaBMicrA B282]|uniref:ScbA/BarX family gamma-butyrolactone biosynthesis protein n=1 Tax=Kitasatospora sp. LaBMicrA B282 TaxID=3420949 RepID=UPI003D0DFB19